MNRIEHVTHRTMVPLQRHTNVFRCITVYAREFLKHILTYLYCTKYNEIDVCHSDTQMYVPHKEDMNSINILDANSSNMRNDI